MILLTMTSLTYAADLRFVVVGDSQTDGDHSSINWDVLPQIIEDMNALDPQLGLFVGDLVNGSSSVTETQAQWMDFKSATAGFNGQVLVVPGNHDVYGGVGTFDAWRQTFPWLPQDDSPPGEAGVSYYWDVGDVRFISVTSDHEDSSNSSLNQASQIWLERVLKESSSFSHIFVMTHHPVSFSTESGTGNTSGALWQSLQAHNVDALFVGHWHRYQPGQLGNGGDTWETIIGTGGGWQGYEPIRPYQQQHGFLLVEVHDDEALATFYGDQDGDGHYDDPLDQFTMRSATAAAPGLRAHYALDGSGEDSAPKGAGIPLELKQSTWTQGKSGQALSLPGEGSWAVAGALNAYELSLLGDLSLSVWLKTDTLGPGDWDNTLICYATNDYYLEDEETNYAYWLSVEPEGTLRGFWEYEDGVNVTLRSTKPATLDDGQWHHLAMTRDAQSKTLRFFVDGAPLGAPVAFERLPTGANRGMLYLGADTEGMGSSELLGSLDDVCIFDLVLDERDIGNLSAGVGCEDVGPQDPKDTGQDSDPQDSDPQDGDPQDSDPQDAASPISASHGCGCEGAPLGVSLWGVLLTALLLAWRRAQA